MSSTSLRSFVVRRPERTCSTPQPPARAAAVVAARTITGSTPVSTSWGTCTQEVYIAELIVFSPSYRFVFVALSGITLVRPSDRCRRTRQARSLLKGLRLRGNRRAAVAPLTVILTGKTMPGTEDGQPCGFRVARCRELRDGGSPPAWR